MPAPRTRRPRFTTGTRICKLCWRATKPGVDMFIVIGMGDDPLLCCPPCAETVLKLRPTGERMQVEEVTPNDQPSLF